MKQRAPVISHLSAAVLIWSVGCHRPLECCDGILSHVDKRNLHRPYADGQALYKGYVVYNVLNVFLRSDWEELRKKGRARFVWEDHVRDLGVPLGIVLGIVDFYRAGSGWGGVFEYKVVLGVLFYVVLGMLITALQGLVEWRQREKKYRDGVGKM